MEIHEGQVIDGLFKIIRKDFSRGANGDIHLAEDSLGQKVALKFIRSENISENLESFKNEYETLLKFSHPNVAKACHFGEWEGQFYIAQEFVDGKEFRLFSIGEPPEKMVPYFIQALEGLEAIHNAQWLHLDIKSSNVLIDKGETAKIIDFGFAMALTGKELPFIRGSLPYMAPEMVLKRPVDNRADLFGMGVLMYYAVTGKYPFFARSKAEGNFDRLAEIVAKGGIPEKPSDLNLDVPPYLDEIILALLSKNPGDRFGTARAVINALKTHHPENYKGSPEVRHSYLIPANNRHIGRSKEQAQIFSSLKTLLGGRQPQEAVFWIEGEEGLGKSHLLKKIKEEGEKNAEKISVHYLAMPKETGLMGEKVGAEWFDSWLGHLRETLIENKKPVLILVDDVELMTPPLKSIFGQAIQRLEKPELHAGQKPTMICFAGGGCLENHPAVVHITLQPFSMEELKDYLATTPALRHQEIPTPWVESLYQRTGGNPSEVVDHLFEKDGQGLLFDLNGAISLAHVREPSIKWKGDGQNIPKTTRKRLTGVLENLGEAEKEILQWLSVWTRRGFFQDISIADLKTLTAKTNCLPVLNALVSKDILRHDSKTGRYFFEPHSWLPHFICNGIQEIRRSEMHQSICERAAGDARLFHQAFGTVKTEALKAALKLGGKVLYEEGMASLAKELFEHGLKMVQPYQLKLHIFISICLIKACNLAALYDEGFRVFETAESQLRTLGKKPLVLETELVLSILPALINSQRFEEAEGKIKEILDRKTYSPLKHYHPVLLNCLAKIEYQKSFLSQKEGKTHLQHAGEVFEDSENMEKGLLEFHRKRIRNNDLGIILHLLGQNRAAVDKLEEKLSRIKEFPNVFIELNTLWQLAEVYRTLENFPKAFERAHKALELGQKTGMGKWILYAHHILAGIHQARAFAFRKVKKIPEARKEFEKALEENSSFLAADACLENRKEVELNLVATFLRNGQCCQELGRLDQAIAYYKAGLDYEPAEIFLGPLYLGLGECFLEKGEILKAAEYLNRSSQIVTALPPEIARESREGIEKAMFKLRKMERRAQHAPAK